MIFQFYSVKKKKIHRYKYQNLGDSQQTDAEWYKHNNKPEENVSVSNYSVNSFKANRTVSFFFYTWPLFCIFHNVWLF